MLVFKQKEREQCLKFHLLVKGYFIKCVYDVCASEDALTDNGIASTAVLPTCTFNNNGYFFLISITMEIP